MLPPSPPVKAIIGISRETAVSMAFITFLELPLVDIANKTSPPFPKARNCLEKISS